MMRARAVNLLLAVTLFAGACGGSAGGAKTPASGGGRSTVPGEQPQTTLVRLTYTRAPLYGQVGRPIGFGVIANYQSSNVIAEYGGVWNDEALTLTEQLTLTIGSRNLIYVTDPAVPPGLPTSILASREGRLRPIPCTPAVTTMQTCYELEVVRGH